MSDNKKKLGSASPNIKFDNEDDTLKNRNSLSKRQTESGNYENSDFQHGTMEWKPQMFRHGMEVKEPEENRLNYKITVNSNTTTTTNTMSSPLYQTTDTCPGFPFGGAFCG